jgi:general secretion pathway protein G
MSHTQKRTGFTLIELLVVITIIGILATGAVTVYTSQIQKARDTTRIRDVDALKGAIEQVYQDDSEYPYSSEFVDKTNTYIKRLPTDQKHGQTCNGGGDCGYAYTAGADENGIEFGAYEVSTAFENEGNTTKKGPGDGGQDDIRFETGLSLDVLSTALAGGSITSENNGACTLS